MSGERIMSGDGTANIGQESNPGGIYQNPVESKTPVEAKTETGRSITPDKPVIRRRQTTPEEDILIAEIYKNIDAANTRKENPVDQKLPQPEPVSLGRRTRRGTEGTSYSDMMKELLEHAKTQTDILAQQTELFDRVFNRSSGEREEEKIDSSNWLMYESQSTINPKILPDGIHLRPVRILDQFGRPIWVYWPVNKSDADIVVRDIAARVETTEGTIDPHLKNELTRVHSILGSIKGEKVIDTDQAKIDAKNKDKEGAEELQMELEARLSFKDIMHQYENNSDLKIVIDAGQGKIETWMLTRLFGITQIGRESGNGKEVIFNPMVEALQYYEDHGEEFIELSSRTDRPKFGKKLQRDLVARFGGTEESYKWAQLLAERIFRISGRAVMFDCLVDKEGLRNYRKEEKEEYRKKFPNLSDDEFEEKIKRGDILVPYTPVPDYLRIPDEYYTGEKRNEPVPEKDKPMSEWKAKYDWLGDGDGTDYDMRRALRQRELYIKDQATLHGFVETLEGVDCYGGDLFTRTPEGVARLFRGEKKLVVYNIPGRERLDREIHNTGGRVGWVNFRLLDRFDFNKMDSGPMGLWVSRNVAGAEAIRKGLSDTTDLALRNPNVATLKKTIDLFDVSKGNSNEAIRNLVINILNFARKTRDKETGKPGLNREGTIAAVNDLAGLVDEKDAPLFTKSDRSIILQKVFGHRFTDLLTNAGIVKDSVLGFFWGILKSILGQGFGNTGK